MSLFDVFKKKSTEEKKPEPKVEQGAKKAIKKAPKKKIEKAAPKKAPKEKIEKAVPKKKPILKASKAWQSLVAPHVTEKATVLTSKNQYVFKVFTRTNKVQIKEAVESLYNVKVEGVKVLNVKPKKRRLGRTKGVKPGYKKAIVTVKKGQEIEILPR